MNFRVLGVLAFGALAVWSIACQASDIVETAVAAGRFKTLVAALKAADLDKTMKGAVPYTVFAPTDEAFAALPEGTLASLLKPENKQKLIQILTYHVVPGTLTGMEIANIDMPQWARTANGQRLSVGVVNEEFQVGNSKVIRGDIRCSNGIIHVIDKVLLPKELRTEELMKMAVKEAASVSLLEQLRSVPDGRFSIFVAAVEASGGDQDWAQAEPSGNWTLFVPTNDAFNRLSDAERVALLDPKNRELLRELLAWHALPKIQPWSFEFQDGERAPVMISRQNDRFVLDVLSNGMVFVYELAKTIGDRSEPFKARILAGDIQVGGNLVNAVDRVIVPKKLEGKFLASQAYREKDVKEAEAWGEAQSNARYVLTDMLKKAESLEGEAAIGMYRIGLRFLEEVVPVSRTGVMMMEVSETNDPAVLRARLRARIDDLDRVWYGMFLKNSPVATTLAGSLPKDLSSTRQSNASEMIAMTAITVNSTIASQSGASPVPTKLATPTKNLQPNQPVAPSVRVSADMSWCEVLEKEVDSKVVTDASLRTAISAAGLPWRVRDKATGIEMLLVPPGQFMMGKIPGDKEAMSNEVPSHNVTLTQPFYLGRYEVTREQWMKLMKASPQPPRQDASGVIVMGPKGAGLQIQPSVELRDEQGSTSKVDLTTQTDADGIIVITATALPEDEQTAKPNSDSQLPILAGWSQCKEFCRKSGLRLPTEAEWEFACRGGVQKPRYGELDQISWHYGNGGRQSHPVGTKAANGLGFHDMIGNAWEWVNDWYSEYTKAAKTDPVGPPAGQQRVIRGGFFGDESGFCRASLRYTVDSPDISNSTGFRVARTP
jgi:uncharacterized surface protein with fasciclin (FAS1) repeats/formylglycine-generating enzyme required for sulfatase activity